MALRDQTGLRRRALRPLSDVMLIRGSRDEVARTKLQWFHQADMPHSEGCTP